MGRRRWQMACPRRLLSLVPQAPQQFVSTYWEYSTNLAGCQAVILGFWILGVLAITSCAILRWLWSATLATAAGQMG